MGKNWICPRDGARLDPGRWREALWEVKPGGRWHYTFTCRGPNQDQEPHEVTVSKSGIRVSATTPRVSHKVDHGMPPAPPPAREPRRTVIVRRAP